MSASVFDRYAEPAIETRMAHRGAELYDALLAGPESAGRVHVAPVFTGNRKAFLTTLLQDFYGWLLECQDEPDAALVAYVVGPQDVRERLVDEYQRQRVEVDFQNGYFSE